MSLFLFALILDFVYDKDTKVMLLVMSVMPLYLLLTAEYSIYGHAMIYFGRLKLIPTFSYFHFYESHKFYEDRLVKGLRKSVE